MAQDPRRLPVLFLPDGVLLPGMVVPIELDEAAQAAVDAARSEGGDELLVAPRLVDRYASYGVRATIEKVGRFRGGSAAAVLRAGGRARIGTGVPGPGAALWVEATPVEDEGLTERAAALAEEYQKLVVAVLQRREAWQIVDSFSSLTDPSVIADTAGYAPYLSVDRKRELLETPSVERRLELLVGWTQDYVAELEVNEKISEDVRESVDKSQREFLLRQQLAAIRKELGEGEPDGTDDYRARVEAAEVPDDVRAALLREVDRLERASDQSPETSYLRTWLDTVLDLPWSVRTDDTTDVAAARAVLDADHHGLNDVKDRIVEHLAVRARRAERGLEVVGGRGSGAVVLLAGPPGVGKTSLGESVARALGRKFVRVALGGVRDEAEIRGHRRTYVGALPGRIARAIKEAGSMNPVVLLDEVDKVGSDYRGDPAAALLEVLDPAQNHTFRDHYLELDLDLSDVLFIATANVLETIPPALLDRMELVSIDGYTEEDKVAIARDFLVPRQRERAALTEDEVSVTDEALRRPRDGAHPRGGRAPAGAAGGQGVPEGGHSARGGRPRPGRGRRARAEGAGGAAPVHAGGARAHRGARRGDRARRDRARWRRALHRGVRTAAQVGTPGRLELTGQLGEVMKESAHIALTYVRAHASELGLDEDALARLSGPVHVHVPAGAVPKDGPSAGVTMTTALVSLATGRTVRGEVGMTGEVVPHRAGPADRRREAEAPGGPAGRAHRGLPARPQRAGPRRGPRRGARRADGAPRPRRARRRRARVGARCDPGGGGCRLEWRRPPPRPPSRPQEPPS